jgi:hypothetical protein
MYTNNNHTQSVAAVAAIPNTILTTKPRVPCKNKCGKDFTEGGMTNHLKSCKACKGCGKFFGTAPMTIHLKKCGKDKDQTATQASIKPKVPCPQCGTLLAHSYLSAHKKNYCKSKQKPTVTQQQQQQ